MRCFSLLQVSGRRVTGTAPRVAGAEALAATSHTTLTPVYLACAPWTPRTRLRD